MSATSVVVTAIQVDESPAVPDDEEVTTVDERPRPAVVTY